MQQPNLQVLGIQYIASKHNHIYNSVTKQYKYTCKLITKLHDKNGLLIRSVYDNYLSYKRLLIRYLYLTRKDKDLAFLQETYKIF